MNVVIVGAGVGGLSCAKRLTRHGDRVKVTLIDRSAVHDFAPSFPWLLNGAREAGQVSRPIGAVQNWGVDFMQTDVTGLDTDTREVITGTGPVGYDELVMAPGAELTFDTIPGLSHAASFYSKDAALDLASRLREFAGGRVQLVIPSMPFKCPAAPYEAAMLIDRFLRSRGVDATVGIHTVEPQPMPVAGPVIGERVATLLGRHGIQFRAARSLREVDASAGRLRFEDGDEPYDLLIAIPPHQAPKFVRDSSLAGTGGWVPVDPHSLGAAAHVHAIGDVTAVTLTNGKPLPKAGVFAHAQAQVVADNLIAEASGKTPKAQFRGHGSCFLESGDGKAGLAKGDFYADPNPRVRMFPPSRPGHLGKVLFERRWLKQLG